MKNISIIALSAVICSSCFCMDKAKNDSEKILNSNKSPVVGNVSEAEVSESIKISDIILSPTPEIDAATSKVINASGTLSGKFIELSRDLDSEALTPKINPRRLGKGQWHNSSKIKSVNISIDSLKTMDELGVKKSSSIERVKHLNEAMPNSPYGTTTEPGAIATLKNDEIIRQITAIDTRYLQYSKGKAIVEVIRNAWLGASNIIRERRDYLSTICSILSKMIHYKNELKDEVLRTFNVNTADSILKSSLRKSTHRWYIDLETFEDQYGKNLEFIQDGTSFVGEIIRQAVQSGISCMTSDGIINYEESKILNALEKVQANVTQAEYIKNTVISELEGYNSIVNQINTNLSYIISTKRDEETASKFENLDILNLQTKLYAASYLANSIQLDNKIFPGAFYKSRISELLKLCNEKRTLLDENQDLFSLRILKVYDTKNRYIGKICDVKLNPIALNSYQQKLEANIELKHTLTLIKFWLLKWRHDLQMTLPGINLE